MISCFTGAVLVFEEELQHAFHKERYFVKPIDTQLRLTILIKNLQSQVKNVKITGVKYYSDAERTVEIAYTLRKGKKDINADRKTPKPEPGKGNENNRRAFMDPYSGKIIGIYNHQQSFFYTMFALHRWLLGGAVGKLITGICTLIFLGIIMTGIVLWWPKNHAILRQRLKIKRDGSWKRINHDLHVVIGFYSAVILFVFAFTALAWSFEWFNNGIYKITNSPVKLPKPPHSVLSPKAEKIPVDLVLQQAKTLKPASFFYNINFPRDSSGIYGVTVLPSDAANEAQTDNLYFDQYTGQLLKQQKFSERSMGQKVRATFKPLHVGSIFGLPSKIISFIACLIGTFLPVTGVIMWLNRMKKRRKDNSYSSGKKSEMLLGKIKNDCY